MSGSSIFAKITAFGDVASIIKIRRMTVFAGIITTAGGAAAFARRPTTRPTE